MTPAPSFYVGKNLPANALYPACLLTPDNWDDYGYETSFTLRIYLQSPAQPTTVGIVKILSSKLETDRTTFSKQKTTNHINNEFRTLDNSFCSLGQSTDYYHNLALIGRTTSSSWITAVLSALNDITLPRASKEMPWYKAHPGYEDSLLRTNGARIAQKDAQDLLTESRLRNHVKNKIRLDNLAGMEINSSRSAITFNAELRIPGRCNVIIGRNGAGKTHFLRAVANWIDEDAQRDATLVSFAHATFYSQNNIDPTPASANRSGQSVKYICPATPDWAFVRRIREAIDDVSETSPQEWSRTLQTMFPTKHELLKVAPEAPDELVPLLESLAQNSDWTELVSGIFDVDHVGDGLISNPSATVQSMSAGQIALTRMYANLFNSLSRQSIALIDEPENFLHPSLISRFMNNLNQLLSKKSAFALITTHSPLVIQETPSRFVWILDRTKNNCTLTQPTFETFGESVENLTEYLFDVSTRESQWRRTLESFVQERLDNTAITNHLSGSGPLSLSARSFIERERRKLGERP